MNTILTGAALGIPLPPTCQASSFQEDEGWNHSKEEDEDHSTDSEDEKIRTMIHLGKNLNTDISKDSSERINIDADLKEAASLYNDLLSDKMSVDAVKDSAALQKITACTHIECISKGFSYSQIVVTVPQYDKHLASISQIRANWWLVTAHAGMS